MDYSLIDSFGAGIDSFRFVLPKTTFLKFLKQIELKDKLRAITRNKNIKEYAEYKFNAEAPLIMPKDNAFKIRYINFKRANKSLTNSMIVLENSNTLNDLCKKRKKPYGFYVMVVFAGLYQPSRDVYKQTYMVLNKFLRRFKTYSYDFAVDFKSKIRAGGCSKTFFRKMVKKFGTNVISYKSTLYANSCRSERFFGLNRICFYNKYEKQTNYHKQKIDPKFKDWHRIELTFKLNEKFLNRIENESYMEYVAVMDEIAENLSEGLFPFGVDIKDFLSQIDFFKDSRKKLSLKKFVA